MAEGQRSYFDIVWKQFRSNGFAYWSLWMLAPLFLVAIFAPLIASNQPFVFWEGEQTIYPWFRALFALDEPVNFAFNMSLLAFFPAVVLAAVLRWRSVGAISGPRLLLQGVGIFLVLTTLLVIVFAMPRFRVDQPYLARSFGEGNAETSDGAHGIFPLLPFGPAEENLGTILKPPLYRKAAAHRQKANDAWLHLLGTDNTGRDVLVQMIYGTRISMTVGFLAVGLYLSIGCAIGALAGYVGGTLDMLISRLIEIAMLFPAFFLILTLVAMLGPSIYIIMFVMGITGWPSIARLTRAEVLKQRSYDYITAARACGVSHARIMFRHLLPNSIGPALVSAPFGIAGAIMTEAGLSLLGFGVRPPTPSWGTLLRIGSGNYHCWWLILFPSLAIFAVVTLFNLLGSGLRDAMDPKLRH